MEKVDGGERSVQVDRRKAVDSGPEGRKTRGAPEEPPPGPWWTCFACQRRENWPTKKACRKCGAARQDTVTETEGATATTDSQPSSLPPASQRAEAAQEQKHQPPREEEPQPRPRKSQSQGCGPHGTEVSGRGQQAEPGEPSTPHKERNQSAPQTPQKDRVVVEQLPKRRHVGVQCMIAHTRPAAADATAASATEGPRAVAHKEQGSLTRRIMPALRPKELVKELAPMVARATTNVETTGQVKVRKRRAAQGRCGASSLDEMVVARGRWQISRQFSRAMSRDPRGPRVGRGRWTSSSQEWGRGRSAPHGMRAPAPPRGHRE